MSGGDKVAIERFGAGSLRVGGDVRLFTRVLLLRWTTHVGYSRLENDIGESTSTGLERITCISYERDSDLRLLSLIRKSTILT